MTLQSLTYLAALAFGGDFELTDLKDGYVRIKTKKYSVEVPKGWEVGEETSFGQREYSSKKGEMSTMTGSAVNRTWDQLYQTSLYFITRSSAGTPTPYRLTKSEKGLDVMSFEMIDDNKKPVSKYVIFKNTKSEILALSVKIKDRKEEKELEKAFVRMVKTAEMK